MPTRSWEPGSVPDLEGAPLVKLSGGERYKSSAQVPVVKVSFRDHRLRVCGGKRTASWPGSDAHDADTAG